jgi:hypothetical protein
LINTMEPAMHLARLLIGCCLTAALSALALADGGAVRALREAGGYRIAVFTSPNPLVAGQVDVSVLVQDAKTHATLDDVAVNVSVSHRGRPAAALDRAATRTAATNKLFRAALFELQPGRYDVEVICRVDGPAQRVRFAMEVGEPLAGAAALWPWFTWPVVPLALFALHLVLSRPPRQSI